MESQLVLDTTVIFGDPILRSTSWRVLEALVEAGDLTVITPEIVVRESVNHRRGNLSQVRELAEKLRTRLSNYSIPLDLPALDDPGVIDAYETRLRKVVESAGRIAAIPGTSHSELVDRAIARHKPFADKGRGYRDALIWENVVEALRDGPVAFVTDNHTDFNASDKDNDGVRPLHPQLAQDLRARGLDPDTLRIFVSLDAYVADEIKNPAQWLRERAGDEATRLLDAVEARYADALRARIREYLLENNWLYDGIEIMSPHTPQDMTIDEVGDIADFWVDEVQQEAPGRLSGVVVASVDLTLDFDLEELFDGEWFRIDRYRENTSADVRVSVELDEESGELTIEAVEGPSGGYIEVYS